jgi:hypothetical protein
VRDLLVRQKPHIKAFAPDEGQNMLIAGDVDLVMEWNGDIVQAMADDDDLDYLVPAEGTNLWIDSLCIPTDAPHPETGNRAGAQGRRQLSHRRKSSKRFSPSGRPCAAPMRMHLPTAGRPSTMSPAGRGNTTRAPEE